MKDTTTPMKRCRDCTELKVAEEFYRHSQMADGRLNSCKECRKAYARARQARGLRREIDRRGYEKLRRENPEVLSIRQKRFREKYPNRAKIYSSVARAIRHGDLEKAPCINCGDPNTEGHHPDYSKPLEVVWLCSTCHKRRHRSEARAAAKLHEVQESIG